MAPVLSLAPSEIHALATDFDRASPTEILRWAYEEFGTNAAIGTSFQGAGLVAIHHAVQNGIPLPVFTIDTDLLFDETLELKTRVETFFGLQIEAISPEISLQQQEAEFGPQLWKRNPDLCCIQRKVWPLQKKLRSLNAWVTGVRRGESEHRSNVQVIELYEFDRLLEQRIIKVNPMTHWSREAIWNYIRKHGIPYNPLTDRGYRSIGCRPCTRPVTSGEDDRAGRWIGFDKTECGIHTFLGENI
ncbi:MAG: phosphoadenylyl-sulfate reductase [Verrucomicrobia bacterium]|nr:phosphoadenylyl-sulfate reductase [Verrucomicrobiota bacterium]MBV9673790.1 phosphoadenylyl-sulfate reductase [Verrucomicrobiota bacterium]